MIDLHVPSDAVGVPEFARPNIAKQTRPVSDSCAVQRKRCDDLVLIMLKRADVQGNFVVEKADATTYDCAGK